MFVNKKTSRVATGTHSKHSKHVLLDAGATGEPWVRMIAARPIPPHSCAAVFFLNVISTMLYEYMKPTLVNPKMVYSAYFKARVQQGEHGALGATDHLPVQPDRVPSMEEVWLDATLGPDGKAGEREQPAKAKQRRSQGPKGKREGAEQVGSPGESPAKQSHAQPSHAQPIASHARSEGRQEQRRRQSGHQRSEKASGAM